MFTSNRTTRVEWCHCDPLGIIFYPRYYEMFDISTTVLIEHALGLSKAEYLKAYDFAGHPLVETRARFLAGKSSTSSSIFKMPAISVPVTTEPWPRMEKLRSMGRRK